MRIIKRIFIALGAVLLALVLFLVASVVVDRLAGGGRLAPLTNTSMQGMDGAEIKAYVARPPQPGRYPAVIMIHEFWGLKEDIIGKADALAQEGYVVVAPNLFRNHTTSWIPSAIFNVVGTPQKQIIDDLNAVFFWVETQPDIDGTRIGIMGFCFGGGTSLRYSLYNPRLAATVVLYGSPVTDVEQLKSLPGPLLGIFGGADQSIPLTQVQAFEAALKAAGKTSTITVYDDQPHSFVGSIEQIRQGGAAGQAWQQILDFFEVNLQSASSSEGQATPSTALNPLPWSYAWLVGWEHAFGGHSGH